jgi:uncharacterized protein (DUF362 family)
MTEKITRRELAGLAGALLMAGFAAIPSAKRRAKKPLEKSRVGLYRAGSYGEDLTGRVLDGMRACGLEVKDKKVLIEAHLEGYSASHSVNADSSVVAGTVEALRKLGASDVWVGVGPTLERDTLALAEAAGYRQAVHDFEKIFVDLSRDDVSAVEGFRDEILYLPVTALRADLVVSVAKMKTDTRSGAALSMENLSGLVPGSVYGWPREIGLDADGHVQFIAELARVFRRSFAVVDGIVGMEGDGPLDGTPKSAGVLVMGESLAATDATCCRIMGIDPARVGNLNRMDARRIEVLGESVDAVRTDFQLVEEHRGLRLG